jgi:hypothetical protein
MSANILAIFSRRIMALRQLPIPRAALNVPTILHCDEAEQGNLDRTCSGRNKLNCEPNIDGIEPDFPTPLFTCLASSLSAMQSCPYPDTIAVLGSRRRRKADYSRHARAGRPVTFACRRAVAAAWAFIEKRNGCLCRYTGQRGVRCLLRDTLTTS